MKNHDDDSVCCWGVEEEDGILRAYRYRLKLDPATPPWLLWICKHITVSQTHYIESNLNIH